MSAALGAGGAGGCSSEGAEEEEEDETLERKEVELRSWPAADGSSCCWG